MARRNGTTVNLESAIALLIHNQAQFMSHLDEDRQRFARIERKLDDIENLLLQHEQILRNLPEAIRQKIGFKKP